LHFNSCLLPWTSSVLLVPYPQLTIRRKGNASQRPVERLIRLGEKLDRSVNYLVVDAILKYLDREEKKL